MKTGFSLLEILHRENPVLITGMGLQWNVCKISLFFRICLFHMSTDFYTCFSTIYEIFLIPLPPSWFWMSFIWFCSVKLQNFSKKIYLLATLVRPLCTGELADLYATTEFCIEVKTIEPLIFLRQWFQRPALRSLE